MAPHAYPLGDGSKFAWMHRMDGMMGLAGCEIATWFDKLTMSGPCASHERAVRLAGAGFASRNDITMSGLCVSQERALRLA